MVGPTVHGDDWRNEDVRIEDEKTRLLAIMHDESLSPSTRMLAFDRLDAMRDNEFEFRMDRIEERFPPEVLRGMVQKHFDSLIAFVRKKMQREYELNDDRRKNGMTYAERKALLAKSKLAALEKWEADLVRDSQSFTVRPVREWFDRADYAMAKKKGMSWIIKINFENVCQRNPQK
jgi:hypothetical protein